MTKKTLSETNDTFEIDNDYAYYDQLSDAEKRVDKKPNRAGTYERHSGDRETRKAVKKYNETHPEPVNRAHNDVSVAVTSKKEQRPTDKVRSRYHDMKESLSDNSLRLYLCLVERISYKPHMKFSDLRLPKKEYEAKKQEAATISIKRRKERQEGEGKPQIAVKRLSPIKKIPIATKYRLR